MARTPSIDKESESTVDTPELRVKMGEMGTAMFDGMTAALFIAAKRGWITTQNAHQVARLAFILTEEAVGHGLKPDHDAKTAATVMANAARLLMQKVEAEQA